jgi:hypothetical protein
MAMPQTFFGRAKSVAGVALVGLGVFILHQNLGQAATQWSNLLGIIPVAGPGALPSVILAAPRVLQAHAADHQSLLQAFFRHMLVSCWPLLLVMIGSAWSGDGIDDVSSSKKDCERVDRVAIHSTSK